MNPLTHEEIQELLGAYALHALDPDEVEIVEQHLEGCPRCQQEVRGHREVTALLGNTGGAAPDGLWDKISTQLEEAPPPMRLSLPEGEGQVLALEPRRRERSTRFVAAALGAAAAVVIGVLGAQVVRQDDRISSLEASLDGSAVTDADVATLVSTDGAVRTDAVLLANGTGYLLADDLPPLTEEQTYQLWGMTSHGLISLGVLGAKPTDVVPFQAGHDVSGLAITQEVAGGVTQSTNDAVVAGEFG